MFASKVMWGFPHLGVPFQGPYKKDYSILGSIYWSPTILRNYQCLFCIPVQSAAPWRVFVGQGWELMRFPVLFRVVLADEIM